jgi:hypothetical protein
MNAAFRAMSNLVADAEDLVARISDSQTPEVRALMETVQPSLERMKERLRRRARGMRVRDGFTRPWIGNPWVYLAAGASLAIGLAACRCLQLRRQS